MLPLQGCAHHVDSLGRTNISRARDCTWITVAIELISPHSRLYICVFRGHLRTGLPNSAVFLANLIVKTIVAIRRNLATGGDSNHSE